MDIAAVDIQIMQTAAPCVLQVTPLTRSVSVAGGQRRSRSPVITPVPGRPKAVSRGSAFNLARVGPATVRSRSLLLRTWRGSQWRRGGRRAKRHHQSGARWSVRSLSAERVSGRRVWGKRRTGRRDDSRRMQLGRSEQCRVAHRQFRREWLRQRYGDIYGRRQRRCRTYGHAHDCWTDLHRHTVSSVHTRAAAARRRRPLHRRPFHRLPRNAATPSRQQERRSVPRAEEATRSLSPRRNSLRGPRSATAPGSRSTVASLRPEAAP